MAIFQQLAAIVVTFAMLPQQCYIWQVYHIRTWISSDVVLLQLTDADQELYKNFPLTVSERWQQEIAETVFDAVNQEADKMEMKRRQKAQAEGVEENCKNTSVSFTTD